MSNEIDFSGASRSNNPYLDSVNEAMNDNDKTFGNGDGKFTVDEAYASLDIGNLLNGQNEQDAEKIQTAAQNIKQTLAEYAGDDGVFSTVEWANFINGKEWGDVLDAWHSSGKKAQMEMNWTDEAGIQDGKMTKGEVKAGILNNIAYLQSQGELSSSVDTTEIEALIDEYAGDDGVFTLEEYQNLRKNSKYKKFTFELGVTPWFKNNSD